MIALLSLLFALCGCVGSRSVTLADVAERQQQPQQSADAAFDWKTEIGDVLRDITGLHAVLNEKEQVYSLTIPRSDLDLKIDGMPVSSAAGLASNIHFYRCSCGKMSVIGEFLVIDYEANDVIDALRPGNLIRVSGVCPIAIGDRPRLLIVRFQGEGDATPMAKLIREATRWTGEQRMKPRKD